MIAALAGAVAVGAIVFVVLHRDSSATASEPTVAEHGVPPEVPEPRPAVALQAARPEVAAPPAPSAPATVSIRISGVPAGTQITLDQHALGTAPGPIVLPRGDTAIEVVVAHAGYLPETVRVVPDHDQELKVVLHAKPRATRPRSDQNSHDPYSIENPFH